MGGGRSKHYRTTVQVLGSRVAGGKFQTCRSIKKVDNARAYIEISELESFLTRNGVPYQFIQEKCPKVRFSRTGTIESVTFVIQSNTFEAQIICLKWSKDDQKKLSVLLNVQEFQAVFTRPVIRQTRLYDGVNTATLSLSRGLSESESAAITQKLKQKVEQARQKYECGY